MKTSNPWLVKLLFAEQWNLNESTFISFEIKLKKWLRNQVSNSEEISTNINLLIVLIATMLPFTVKMSTHFKLIKTLLQKEGISRNLKMYL